MDLILTSVLLIFITIYEIKFFLYHENEEKKKADQSKKFMLGGVLSLVAVCLLRTYI